MAALNFHGRGASLNPPNRFELLYFEPVEINEPPGPDHRRSTQLLRDDTQTILSRNQSPDIGFEYSLNPYRGCEHGCPYCYARPTHEYLGFSAGLDFESRILVKEEASELLREELSNAHWKPQVIALSGVTDCYQPIERRLELTRRCVKVLTEFRNPVFIVTKNRLVVRDIDILAELSRWNAVGVTLSITTLDPELARKMEPRASTPAARLDAIAKLSSAGIPVGVNVAPVVPGLNDHEIPRILESAANAGARFAFYTLIRLPLTVAPIFTDWLRTHFPSSAEKILNRIRSMRGGKLNDPRFGSRMKGEGIFADQIRQTFEISRRRARLSQDRLELSTKYFRRVLRNQPELLGLDLAPNGSIETG
jgi:DNA repair photolyase